ALTLDHHHFDPFAPGPARRAAALARRLKTLGLGVVIETGARYLLNPRDKHEPTLVTADPDGRALRIKFLCRAIDIAGHLGAEAVSFWAGVPKSGVLRVDAMHWLNEGLAQVCDYAAMAQVPIALEPEPGMLIETVDDYDRLADNHPTLRLALDTGHCLVTQDIEPDAAVRLYAEQLGTVAIEDMRRGDHTHLPFGQGNIDLPKVLAALEGIGFSKLVCVELSRESPRAHAAIPEAMAALRQAQERLAIAA
ncbi:MAG: sugar phosphate isomerase/epimerase family protein, partial [Sphingorhabdus sp.]